MKRYILMLAVIILSASSYAQLPSIQLKNLKGKTVNTAKIGNGGKPFVICFFASWCKPCNRELKAINEVYADWQDETGVKIYAISIDQGQNAQKVKPMVDAEGWEYDVLLDPNGEFKQALGVQNIPHTIVCDGNGKIQFRHTAYKEGGEKEIIKEVKSLLKKK